MRFERLSVSNVRCLKRIEFEPGPETCVILGANGTGKTSLLEGFALASLGKSFLSNRSFDIVRSGEQGLAVRALLADAKGTKLAVAVRKVGSQTAITLDGQAISAASVLAQRVPMLVINSKAADILTENPSNRRALIDRTMFHVEPSYVSAWKHFRLALRQRNELLRRQAPVAEATFWNGQLARYAGEIDAKRTVLVAAINAALVGNPLTGVLGQLSLDYSPGWNRAHDLVDQLGMNWPRDIKLGHTGVGIHRADLALKADGRSISRRLSRGQGKFIVCSILMALARFIESEAGEKPVILVDDLAAELDDKMRAGVVDMITERGGQRVFTAIKPGDLPELTETAETLFHVEQLSQAAYA